jgi:N-acetyl-1-D-myo-inositol-2-amino-2-deoxy-alpha-D-glucopyranoside deacetylase
MTEPSLAGRRLLLVHAHPDDETISTGVTMARYVREGVSVTLLTCTLGEEGEVLVPELEQIGAAHDDQLGAHREKELAAAMAVLGVTDHRFLGGTGRYRDSGMMGLATNDRPDAFWRADLLEASTEVCAVVREVRPQVLVTYDQNGEYGHPDHIQAHRVATYGAALAAAPAFRTDLGPAWDVPKIYWTAVPRSMLERGLEQAAQMGKTGFFGVESADDLPWVVDDELVTTHIDGIELEPVKMAALREHRSQVDPSGPFFEMAEVIGPDAFGREYYSIAKGVPGPHRDENGWETDLFDGLG